MSLRHILLGLLSEPASGYDMHKECKKSLALFWSMNLSQIYPALQRLEDEGFVASDMQASGRGPARRVYHRTKKGAAAVIDWLTAGPQVAVERKHYLVQVFFLNALKSPAQAQTFLYALREKMEMRRQGLLAIIPEWEAAFGDDFPDRLSGDALYRHFTFDLGLDIFTAYVNWCDRCIERLENNL